MPCAVTVFTNWHATKYIGFIQKQVPSHASSKRWGVKSPPTPITPESILLSLTCDLMFNTMVELENVCGFIFMSILEGLNAIDFNPILDLHNILTLVARKGILL